MHIGPESEFPGQNFHGWIWGDMIVDENRKPGCNSRHRFPLQVPVSEEVVGGKGGASMWPLPDRGGRKREEGGSSEQEMDPRDLRRAESFTFGCYRDLMGVGREVRRGGFCWGHR